MITTITLNAAVDVTYTMDRVVAGTSHRVTDVHRRAGGKGVNVARVLMALGHPATVTGLVGGTPGAMVRSELADAGLRVELVEIAGDTRQTVTVVDQASGDASVFLEPGPSVTTAEWTAFKGVCRRLLAESRVVVLSGSLPAGLPDDAYAELVALAAERDVPAVLDTVGAPLLNALGAGPALVKPNREELRETLGTDDAVAGARHLLRAGARAVVVSLGADGMIALTAEGDWRAVPPRRIPGNPTGAGDAAIAALSAGIAEDIPWPERLRRAVAVSAAAVRAPLAGDFDSATYHELLGLVETEPLRTGP
ncbi:1-phosphofructokinase family hexose kinase [Streptomyces sp. NBC_00059]|uniref:1-phosphofructokinase family hexose kinase n=1 Tax=Streptomyces sp. NBC_00059 TaxID=2975635 RepID=UPI0022501E4C|nr:1-phosphofructokinase family hexose kinase [Streptomyces sp. NBC_00059]MCX5414094.1 1-phosphofructokinase family hexose kinase [Streptomyces sp. NBC_00059]